MERGAVIAILAGIALVVIAIWLFRKGRGHHDD